MNAPTEATLQQDTATLYERLGSRPGIEAIVEDIWNNHVSNPLVNKRYAHSARPRSSAWSPKCAAPDSAVPRPTPEGTCSPPTRA